MNSPGMCFKTAVTTMQYDIQVHTLENSHLQATWKVLSFDSANVCHFANCLSCQSSQAIYTNDVNDDTCDDSKLTVAT